MRIIAGSAGGRVLKSFRGPGVRPTADRVRESWFGALGARVLGAHFLDLYAGTGAVGIEALSRGAARCVLVERSRQGAAVVRENLKVLGDLPAGAAEVRAMDALAAPGALEREGREFDLVFADPPYEDAAAPGKVLERLGRSQRLLAPGAQVTIQHSKRVALPEVSGRLRRTQARTYGDTALSVYEVDDDLG
ncbi:MAG: 16S rRNA (guanine(966)-N(2))-methyltransferase RsmD [Armatimonadetes bacterium]|nr:16S rRNA (guanine(966)-N(2))-methyltransferase RsmD [Armatimonadota bacterium]